MQERAKEYGLLHKGTVQRQLVQPVATARKEDVGTHTWIRAQYPQFTGRQVFWLISNNHPTSFSSLLWSRYRLRRASITGISVESFAAGGSLNCERSVMGSFEQYRIEARYPPIGGPHQTVEVDESCFHVRKYGRGQERAPPTWVVGGEFSQRNE